MQYSILSYEMKCCLVYFENIINATGEKKLPSSKGNRLGIPYMFFSFFFFLKLISILKYLQRYRNKLHRALKAHILNHGSLSSSFQPERFSYNQG